MSELGADVEALYREVVLEHYRRPRNRRALDAADGSATVVNELCGDQVRVDVALDAATGRVREAAAIARGCSLAVASGSVMTELVPGLDREAAAGLARALEQLIEGGGASPALEPRLRAFERVVALPSRRRCVMLGWEALDAALAASAAPGSADREG